MSELEIDQIIIGERRREDMGDIQALAESISRYGLLHPIVVDEQNHLVAGGRRLEAVKRLGWGKVAVTLLRELAEHELRAIELEENIRRKDLTEIEKSRNMVELAEIKKEEARQKPAKKACCETPVKPAGLQPEICQKVPCCGLCEEDCNSKQPCEFKEKDLSTPRGDNPAHRPIETTSIRNIAKEIGVPEQTLRDARQHVAAVDKYPVLEQLPKKQAIQTGKQLDKLPEDVRPAIIREMQEPKEQDSSPDIETFRKAERFKEKVDRMITFFGLISKHSPADYFAGLAPIERATLRGFFGENKLSIIDDGIRWLNLFRDEFEKQILGDRQQQGLRRVK